MRRFPARPGTPGSTANAVHIVIPPRVPPAAGGGSDGGGCTDQLSLFVQDCVTLQDGRLFLLGIHGLAPDADVLWTATAYEAYNYIVSEDGVTSASHVVLAYWLGGALTVSVAVNGTEIGVFDAQADDVPDTCLSIDNPHPPE